MHRHARGPGSEGKQFGRGEPNSSQMLSEVSYATCTFVNSGLLQHVDDLAAADSTQKLQSIFSEAVRRNLRLDEEADSGWILDSSRKLTVDN